MRVVKLGGRVQSDPTMLDRLAGSAIAAPGALCIVHGGGDEISSLQHRLGVTAKFSGGRRVTGASDIDLVRMALSGLANKRLVSGLVQRGVPAFGLSGEDGGLFVARPADPQLGLVGIPSEVRTDVLRWLLAGGFVPVISPVSASSAGSGALNVNGDDAAAALAAALQAEELLLLADVPAVLSNGTPVGRIGAAGAQQLIMSGAAGGGMAAKLEAAIGAVERGVQRVRIGGLELLSSPGAGTIIEPGRPLSVVPSGIVGESVAAAVGSAA